MRSTTQAALMNFYFSRKISPQNGDSLLTLRYMNTFHRQWTFGKHSRMIKFHIFTAFLIKSPLTNDSKSKMKNISRPKKSALYKLYEHCMKKNVAFLSCYFHIPNNKLFSFPKTVTPPTIPFKENMIKS